MNPTWGATGATKTNVVVDVAWGVRVAVGNPRVPLIVRKGAAAHGTASQFPATLSAAWSGSLFEASLPATQQLAQFVQFFG